jgi:hypothetical protein
VALPLDPMDHSVDHVVDLAAELLDQRVSFRLADLLNNHLLGRLSPDPSDRLFVQDLTVQRRLQSARLAIDVDIDIRLFAVLRRAADTSAASIA